MTTTASRRDLRQHLQVETPEQVALDYEIAGVGSRAAAALVDQLLIALLVIAMVVIVAVTRVGDTILGPYVTAVLILGGFAIWYGYFIVFEAFRQGQTPGKRLAGIRVVADSGRAVSPGGAVVRNLLRIADFLPPPYLGGALLVALHPRGRRLGDMIAGTIVVRDRPTDTVRRPSQPAATLSLDPPRLDPDELRLLDAFVTRAERLEPAVRARLAAQLEQRLAHALDDEVVPGVPAGGRLAQLLDEERARRQGSVGAVTAGAAAARLAARQSARWDAFDQLARRVQRHGLDSLQAEELPDFAARYREVAADLARLRTYHADTPLLQRVERLVAAGHNALYRSAGGGLGRAWRIVSRECPAAVVAAWPYVLIAFLSFAIPAVVGYRMLRDEPALAEQVLPDVMLERAAEGQSRAASGGRYVETERTQRPAMASWIIANNVRVAFYCFAGGLFVGLGALLLLGLNGLQLGASMGHFVNVGLGAYLGEFVLGHGALELSAIWIAGAAGFMLGKTLVAPGELARRDALVLAGRRAARMLGAAVTCLIVAGLIEGLVSASAAGWTGRVVASGASLLFLAVYLLSGGLARARARAG